MKNKQHISLSYFLFSLLFFCFQSPFATASIVISNGLTHIHKVNEGQVVKGVIEIQNTDLDRRAIRVYQKDYLYSHNGEVYYNEPGSNPRSNAIWMDYSPSYMELESQQKTIINYEITIPAGQELVGSYWSILMVEGISPITEANQNAGVNISTVMRYAIQIVTNFGDSGKNSLEFLEAKLDKVDGVKVGMVALENNGERLLIPEISIELFNSDGVSVGIIIAKKKKIYPGTSARFYLDLAGIPKGNYQAVVLADCAEEDIFGLNLTLALGDD